MRIRGGKYMDKRYFVIFIVFIMIIIGFSGCIGSRYTDYFNEQYIVDENTVLKVSTINGQIEINGWDEDKIEFNAVMKSTFSREDLELVEIDVDETEDEIEIEAYYTGTRRSQPSVDMNIKIPDYVIVERVTTSNGAILISDVKGDIKAETSNGQIRIDDVDGYIKAITSNGKIDIEDTTGIMDLKSSNSGIEAEIFDFKEDIEISTSNGGITLYINPSLNANLDISTSNGIITIDDDLNIVLSVSDDKQKEGQLGDGGNEIYISTSNGNIKIYKLDI
jgi:DUF4097 and DUF4098 domain-containing protein YvlB